MGAQQLWHLSFMLTWIFVSFLPAVCSGMETPKIQLESTVFVAFAGKKLDIECELTLPVNQTKDVLTCFDPFPRPIYNCDVPATAEKPEIFKVRLELKNLSSGEYSCEYKTAKVYWFLRVRDEGYKELKMWDDTEFIIVAVFTGVLLVFSVVGSVYVFRGYWKERSAECGNTGRKQKQNREERKRTEEENVDVITSPSTSFYASLEPRPRSIYDVLDRSAANTEPDQSKAKPKKKEPQKTMVQTTKPQDEGVFESVYENF